MLKNAFCVESFQQGVLWETIDHPKFVNALNEHQTVVTNALLRIVHGGWDVNVITILQNKTAYVEHDMSGFKEKSVKDYWVEEGKQVVRVHNKKRNKLFLPKESPHPTIPEHMFKDSRVTLRINGKEGEESKEHKDNWRIDGNDINNNGIKWTGRTVFEKRSREQYLSAPSPTAGNMSAIPLKDMFVAGHVSSKIVEGRGVRSVILIMKRQSRGREEKFTFEPNDEDFELMKVLNKNKGLSHIEITMWEIPNETPRFVLLCSEETNWFTMLNAKRQEKYGRREGIGEINLLVVTITIHDDLNSDYGFHKASISLRDSRDTMFFAGPCTGGSSWARLNRTRGPQTEEIIEAKVLIFQQLWGRFEVLFVSFYDRCIGIYMELPRGCQYWKNDEVRFMIEGTESTIHDFDGCCYGLRQRFGDSNMYIKKPWRIVSWNVDLGGKLSLKCDGRHEHAPCAGRETLHTQIYTSKIVSIVLEEQLRRSSFAGDDSPNVRNTGSKGRSSKSYNVSMPCVTIDESYETNRAHDHNERCIQVTITITCFPKRSRKVFAKWLWWNRAPQTKKQRYLKSGLSPSGAAGAGRARFSGGHKSCPDAMAASGSGHRPHGDGDKPPMFSLGEEKSGVKYIRVTGEIVSSLIDDENQGKIQLPARFGDGITGIALVEGWSAFGIPRTVLAGLVLGEVATEKERLLNTFKTVVRLVKHGDMDLDLYDASLKLRKICQAVCVGAVQYVERDKSNDIHSMGPIMQRLATAQALTDGGPGVQNLVALIEEKKLKVSLGTLVGVATPSANQLQNAPFYRCRNPWWYQFFNHAMKANPGAALFHTIDSLEVYAKDAKQMMSQIALCVRIYNQGVQTINGKLKVSTLVFDICRIFRHESSPVVFLEDPLDSKKKAEGQMKHMAVEKRYGRGNLHWLAIQESRVGKCNSVWNYTSYS